MIVTDETKRLAQGVYDFFLTNPKQHAQLDFFDDTSNGDARLSEENICNTTMCIAGATIYLDSGVTGLRDPWAVYDDGYPEVAANLLGLSDNEAYQIFYNMSNESARNMVLAIANGDKEKFDALAEARAIEEAEHFAREEREAGRI